MSPIRSDILANLIRYLDTDTLLCWAPASSEASSSSSSSSESEDPKRSLRDLQIAIATPIIAYLTSYVWPGTTLLPSIPESLTANSIVPTAQPPTTRAVISGWIAGLGPWELAGLERAVLAGKSLCVASRLIVEWAESFKHLSSRRGNGDEKGNSETQRGKEAGERIFGIDRACEACSLEVQWQTEQWGEVEDSHDVEKEDLRRQFGSVVLLVGGTDEGG